MPPVASSRDCIVREFDHSPLSHASRSRTDSMPLPGILDFLSGLVVKRPMTDLIPSKLISLHGGRSGQFCRHAKDSLAEAGQKDAHSTAWPKPFCRPFKEKEPL